VQQWAGALRYAGIGLLFLVVYSLILRPIKKQALAAFRQVPGRLAATGKTLVAATASGPAEVLGGSSFAPVGDLAHGNEESRRAAQLKKQLTDKVRTEPEAASRLLQTWVREGNQK
jgi:flagellar M-ring protein FliF